VLCRDDGFGPRLDLDASLPNKLLLGGAEDLLDVTGEVEPPNSCKSIVEWLGAWPPGLKPAESGVEGIENKSGDRDDMDLLNMLYRSFGGGGGGKESLLESAFEPPPLAKLKTLRVENLDVCCLTIAYRSELNPIKLVGHTRQSQSKEGYSRVVRYNRVPAQAKMNVWALRFSIQSQGRAPQSAILNCGCYFGFRRAISISLSSDYAYVNHTAGRHEPPVQQGRMVGFPNLEAQFDAATEGRSSGNPALMCAPWRAQYSVTRACTCPKQTFYSVRQDFLCRHLKLLNY
jgi:hypothetical protein